MLAVGFQDSLLEFESCCIWLNLDLKQEMLIKNEVVFLARFGWKGSRGFMTLDDYLMNVHFVDSILMRRTQLNLQKITVCKP